MKWLLESGIDGIITNRPGLLFEQVVRHDIDVIAENTVDSYLKIGIRKK